MTPKKRVAIVGLGKIGLFHLSILRNLDEVELVGLVDEKTSVQKTVKGMGVNVPFFKSIEDLIENAMPQGIFACVPPVYNPAVAEACIPKGVALLVEKPMAASLADAEKMVALLKSQMTPPANAVGHMVAYYPAFEKAGRMLQEIGQIKGYDAELFLGEVFKKQEGWRQNPKISGGGALAILGSHLLCILITFFDMPESVTTTEIKREYSDVENEIFAQLNYPNHITGSLKVSWSKPHYSEMGFKIDVAGSSGTLIASEKSIYLLPSTGNIIPMFLWDLVENTAPKAKFRPNQPGYLEQDLDFIRAIGTGKETRVSWEHGLKIQKVIDAIYRSADSNRQTIRLS